MRHLSLFDIRCDSNKQGRFSPAFFIMVNRLGPGCGGSLLGMLVCVLGRFIFFSENARRLLWVDIIFDDCGMGAGQMR
jgi:hypothetical protein